MEDILMLDLAWGKAFDSSLAISTFTITIIATSFCRLYQHIPATIELATTTTAIILFITVTSNTLKKYTSNLLPMKFTRWL